jgi:hypothetical protein
MSLVQRVIKGQKPAAVDNGFSWAYVEKQEALDKEAIFDRPEDNLPAFVFVAPRNSFVGDIIKSEDIDYFSDLDVQGALKNTYQKLQSVRTVEVLKSIWQGELDGDQAISKSGEQQAFLVVEVLTGLLLGYPRCCVKYYVQVNVFNQPAHLFQEANWMFDTEYLMCPECLSKLQSALSFNKVQKDSWCDYCENGTPNDYCWRNCKYKEE